MITIIEQDEDPPENNNEEEYQHALETMEEGTANVLPSSHIENGNDTTMQSSDEEPCGVGSTTESETQQGSSNTASGEGSESNDETDERRLSQ